MVSKSLMLVILFVIAFGIDTNNAKDKSYRCPCECIELLTGAYDAIMEVSYCDFQGVWEAPQGLKDQFEDLQNWCSKRNKPLKSKTPEIIEEMLETINKAIVGESQTINGKTIVINDPAPDCAIEALLNLQNLLLYGCPVQIIN